MVKKIDRKNTLEFINILVILISITVILGWSLNLEPLKSVFTNYRPMRFNSALNFIFSSVIFYSLVKQKYKLVAFWLSIIVSGYGLAVLFQYILNVNFGFDEFFIDDTEFAKSDYLFPGRPSPTTALCFFLYGLSYLGINNTIPLLNKAAQYLLQVILLVSFVSILRILFNAPSIYENINWSPMPFHVCFIFILLATGTCFTQKKYGLVKLFLGNKIGNIMFRSLFLKTFIALFILGLLRYILYNFNVIPLEFGFALFNLIFIVIVMQILAKTAIRLNKIDVEKKRIKSQFAYSNKTLEKKIEKRTFYLSNQNKQLEEFSFILSHNLRGPISNINSLLDLYKMEDMESEKDDLVDKIDKTVQNLRFTLDELLEVILVKNDLKKEKVPIDFQYVFNLVQNSYLGKIMESDILVTADFSKAPSIEYDYIYLYSIMENLLSNALKYRSYERSAFIHFETDVVNGNIQLAVSDNGLGIDLKENGSRIFGFKKIFHKHPEARGVGLYITKAQVNAMGGEISVDSEVNKGTTFKIVF